ncbi:MAG TPA: glycoside hydrolase N-terminal domain-containing protein, partial [Erysipelothrix sp.]
MKLIYNYETGHRYQDWVNEGLPIGNGFLGAKIYGSATHERIQINEKSLWTGGPLAADTKNEGGNIASSHIALDKIQSLLVQGNKEKAAALAQTHLVGPHDRAYGSYIPLLDYDFIFEHHEDIS